MGYHCHRALEFNSLGHKATSNLSTVPDGSAQATVVCSNPPAHYSSLAPSVLSWQALVLCSNQGTHLDITGALRSSRPGGNKPVFPTLRRQRQENHECEGSLGFIQGQ